MTTNNMNVLDNIGINIFFTVEGRIGDSAELNNNNNRTFEQDIQIYTSQKPVKENSNRWKSGVQKKFLLVYDQNEKIITWVLDNIKQTYQFTNKYDVPILDKILIRLRAKNSISEKTNINTDLFFNDVIVTGDDGYVLLKNSNLTAGINTGELLYLSLLEIDNKLIKNTIKMRGIATMLFENTDSDNSVAKNSQTAFQISLGIGDALKIYKI